MTPASTPVLEDFRRIVIKVGSALLVDDKTGAADRAWLEALAASGPVGEALADRLARIWSRVAGIDG